MTDRNLPASMSSLKKYQILSLLPTLDICPPEKIQGADSWNRDGGGLYGLGDRRLIETLGNQPHGKHHLLNRYRSRQ